MDEMYERPGSCKHPQLTDEMFDEQEVRIARSWGNVGPLQCPDCKDWLWVENGVIVDEPTARSES